MKYLPFLFLFGCLDSGLTSPSCDEKYQNASACLLGECYLMSDGDEVEHRQAIITCMLDHEINIYAGQDCGLISKNGVCATLAIYNMEHKYAVVWVDAKHVAMEAYVYSGQKKNQVWTVIDEDFYRLGQKVRDWQYQ